MIKVSDYIVRRLKEHYAIEHVFLITGGGAMYLNDSFGTHIDYITAHNEQALAIMAEGYARPSGKLAVVNVTTGPGGLNCLNGVFGQWTDSVPVLYISGQVKFTTTISSCPEIQLRQLGDQEVDIISVVKPITKYSVMITDPLSIKYHLDKAIYEATHSRKGPVWLDIPLDIQGALIDETQLKEFTPPEDPIYDCQMNHVIQKLKEAKRPLIIAGQGIRLSGQLPLFLDLLKKIKIPVVTTFCGMDIIPSDHPNFAGRIGMVGQRAGNFVLQNADCILFLGTRNSIFQVSYNYENFAKNAYKIIVDIDSAELEKPTISPDLKIHADLAQFLPSLYQQSLPIIDSEWFEWCENRKNLYSFQNTKEYQQIGSEINPYFFVRILSMLISKNSMLITANGSACVMTYQVAKVHFNQRIFWNKGSASMGYGLPASIGAAIRGDSVICLEGDGSIMMNIQELQTIKEYNLPIKIFIINNGGYSCIKQTQTNLFNKNFIGCDAKSYVSTPDFSSIANAFGLKSVVISSPENMEEQIQQVLDTDGPVLCEVYTTQDYTFIPKLSARRLDDGTIVSPSLEDMSPVLSREELEKNIYEK
ncbi:MAG: thiamine pyrophosphate-binding protein [Brevinema sp.]